MLFLCSQPILAIANIAWFLRFNKTLLPEGLTYCNKTLYVGIASTQKIYRVSEKGKLSLFATLPSLGKNNGIMTGIICGKSGKLYAALDSKNIEIPSGVYQISSDGGKAKLFASSKYLVFPNGFVFDRKQNLYVADSQSNSILKIASSGKVYRWAHGKLFSGDPAFCPQKGTGKIMGANGITIDQKEKNIYVTNTDKASLIKIPILKNGSSGKPRIIVGPNCNLLAGADGVISYKKFFLIAINRQNKLIAINQKTFSTKLIHQGAPLSFPASLVVMHTNAGDALFATNFSVMAAITNPGQQTPGITLTHFSKWPVQ